MNLLVIVEVTLLIGLAAIASGLNVALLALDRSDLERKAKLGDTRAKLVLPLRRNTHLSLASILLMGVAVAATTSLVLKSHLNAVAAGALTTILIVLFGEIIPQAFFARYALTFTAFFAPFLRAVTIITYPVSKPLQLLLDALLGDEQTRLPNRRELGIIISEQAGHNSSDLDDDEIEIMKGAIGLSEKRVRDIMTPVNKVFWLTPQTELNGTKIDEIKESGHSRIPIFNQALNESQGILLVKDLVDIDFDDNDYLVSDMPLHKTELVGSMTALDTLFRRFIKARAHLLPVEREDKIVGIVTIEDLIEEIIGHEIEDESDNRRKSIIPLPKIPLPGRKSKR